MDRHYFTFWIAKYGKQNFKELIDKACHKISVPEKILEKKLVDEYLFNYFYVVYFTIMLHLFGISEDKIGFILDYSLTPGVCKLFSPSEILKVQKDLIPEIKKYIDKDLAIYTDLFEGKGE